MSDCLGSFATDFYKKMSAKSKYLAGIAIFSITIKVICTFQAKYIVILELTLRKAI